MKNLIFILLSFYLVSNSQSGEKTIWVSDLNLSLVDQQRGEAGKNKTPMGGEIKMAGVTYENGVGIMAPAKLLIELNGDGNNFQATVGPCEMSFPAGGPGGPGGTPPGAAPGGAPGGAQNANRPMNVTMQFFVLGDKEILWKSGEMKRDDKPQKIDIDISGIEKLALVAIGSGRFGGIGAWADAKITYSGKTVPTAIPNNVVLDSQPVVLTPKVNSKPKINYPKVIGATPGKQFIFSIPVTGDKPLTITVENLPEGLKLDAETGIITGKSPEKKETYDLKVTAKNSVGEAKDIIQLKVGDLLALTPPMGWNSWNAGGMSVDQVKVKAASDVISEKLRGHGWAFVNIDDGWQAVERNADGFLLTNEKFTDIKGMGEYIHSNGLKFGIYSSPGPQTCGRALGSYQHEYQDANTWSEWGVDYLKYDWCAYRQIAKDNSLEELQKPYFLMRDALNKTGRDVVYSLCQYGMGDVYKWGADVGGNLWRTTGDITDTWNSVLQTGFSQTENYEPVGPGHWNDPDMLVIGYVGWNKNTQKTKLTFDEQYAHVSLWSLLSSPLLIGCEMDKLDDFTLGLITNDEVIGVNQDILGKQARLIVKGDDYQVWAKDLSDGSKAVGIFYTGTPENSENTDPVQMINWGDKEIPSEKLFSISLAELGLHGKQNVRDLWRQKEIGTCDNIFDTEVNYHGVVLIKLSPVK